MMRVKNEDTVLVIAGKDKGKRGAVMAVHPKSDMVMVQGVNMQTHYVKKSRAASGAQGGITLKEGLIALSNVMPVCPSCKKPCRVNISELADNKRARLCNRCKQAF